MSHGVYKNRFASFRKAAWHRLGTVFQDPKSAFEAFLTMGEYNVSKEPLFVYAGEEKREDGIWYPKYDSVPGKYAVTGRFPDTKTAEIYGLADDRYELISPRQLVSLWDTVTNAKIETMGCLQKGKRFFLTTELPGFEVKGDEHRNYLSILSPHGPGQSLIGLISPVRVVCANTAQMALEAAQQQCKVPHFKGAFNVIGAWLKEQYEGAVDRTAALQEALNILASRKVENNADEFINELFPMPEDDASEAADKVQDVRNNVANLFAGQAVGSETESFKGTYFGLYNSVVEHVDYYTRSKQTVFAGAAAAVKEKAFALAMKVS
jgi:phage/plasmid-like protein (TIGR03299 family)